MTARPRPQSRKGEDSRRPLSILTDTTTEGKPLLTPSRAGILALQTGPEDGGTQTHAKAIGAEFQDQDYLINMKEVMRRTGSSRSTINHLMRYSDFPLPLKLGVKMNRWWSGEIDLWLRSRPRAKGDLGQWHSRVEDQD